MDLLRYVLPHFAAGCLGGLVAACGVVASNTGPLRQLILHTEGGWIAASVLAVGFMATFGSAAIGRALMLLSEDER